MNHQSRSNTYLFVISVLLAALFNYEGLLSQQFVQRNLFLSPYNISAYEINKIKFSGNSFYSQSDLKKIIKSNETSISWQQMLLHRVDLEIKRNKPVDHFLPRIFLRTVEDIQNELSKDVKYFNRINATQDVASIRNFYRQNGFHQAMVSYTFDPDSSSRENILTFHIDEGKQYKISSINYNFLPVSLPPEITILINEIRKIKKGDAYSESELLTEASKLHRMFLENGYFYCSYKIPQVKMDSVAFTDSIIINFNTGKRQRIESVHFVDSLHGQTVVVKSMKEKQIEFKPGDWYSVSKVERSLSNMLSLGTFDYIDIDTTSRYPLDGITSDTTSSNSIDSIRGPKHSGRLSSDTSLSFVVISYYRKQQDWGLSTFINRTAMDNVLNVGVEASYSHRNIFGAAQNFNPYARVVLNDLSRSITDLKRSEFELQLGINFTQPLLTTIDVARIGFSFQPLYSLRTLDQGLRLQTITLPFKFPTVLPKWTYFNSFEFSLSLENQYPINFDNSLSQAFSSAKTLDDTVQIIRAFYQYDKLKKFSDKVKPYFTGDILGFTALGDTRDNPFSPTKGRFSAVMLDGWNFLFYPIDRSIGLDRLTGIAKFLRLQMTDYWFWSLSKQSVFALKQREGYIFWFDRGNSYIPLERQFFAGGANSVRGWPSRGLRYSPGIKLDTTNQGLATFMSDYVGSSILIEGSMELRYRFIRPENMSPGLADQIANLGITGFIDWGNAFQWLIVDSSGNYLNKYKAIDFIKGLAWAAGFGFRYETPVGPIRIDFGLPVYDPSRTSDKLIFARRNVIGTMQFHLGLGHAF
jgi:outer membrane protein assembly factor BamA